MLMHAPCDARMMPRGRLTRSELANENRWPVDETTSEPPIRQLSAPELRALIESGAAIESTSAPKRSARLSGSTAPACSTTRTMTRFSSAIATSRSCSSATTASAASAERSTSGSTDSGISTSGGPHRRLVAARGSGCVARLSGGRACAEISQDERSPRRPLSTSASITWVTWCALTQKSGAGSSFSTPTP
jgi:hypothetical protein